MSVVTEIAVVERLQRVLRRKGERLRVVTSQRQRRWGLGRFYLLDGKRVISTNVNIEKLARRVKVLQPWETLDN
jgi:hypothetical protein